MPSDPPWSRRPPPYRAFDRNEIFCSNSNRTEWFVPVIWYSFFMTETNAGQRRGQHGPMSGRQAEAARNDQRILDSARAVFVADPGAPITAVAKRAHVGISALYTRYSSKEELLRTLCTDGLLIVVKETETALERVRKGEDRWRGFADLLRHLAPAHTSSMTRALPGPLPPPPDLYAPAQLSSHAI